MFRINPSQVIMVYCQLTSILSNITSLPIYKISLIVMNHCSPSVTFNKSINECRGRLSVYQMHKVIGTIRVSRIVGTGDITSWPSITLKPCNENRLPLRWIWATQPFIDDFHVQRICVMNQRLPVVCHQRFEIRGKSRLADESGAIWLSTARQYLWAVYFHE